MDSQNRDDVSDGKRYGVLKTPKRRRRIFINAELHHIIYINIPGDLATTYNYIQEKTIQYPYRNMKKHAQKAYLINEVAKIVNRHPDRIRVGIRQGGIRKPQRAGPTGKYYFSDDDIVDIQDYFANIHFGRPRKDGIVKPLKRTVTKEEVDAKLGRRDVLYVQNEDGDFIPVWRTIDF